MASHLSERIAFCATIHPDALDVGIHVSNAVSLQQFGNALFVVCVGSLGGGGTVDFVLQEAESETGTFVNMATKCMTQLNQTSGDHFKQAIIEVRADELSPGKSFVRGVVTVGTSNCNVSMVCFGGDPRFAPAGDQMLPSLVEIVR